MAMTDDAPLVSIDEEPVCTVAPADSVEDRPRATTREFLEAMPAASTAVSHKSAANTPTAKRIDNGNRRWHIALAANNAFGQGSSASEGGFSPLYHIPAHSHMLSVGTSTFDATYLKATTNNIDEATATDDIVSFPVSYSASFRYMLTDHWGINAGISYAYATSERRSGSESDYYSSKIRMHYIGIPITVSYTFLSSRYVSLYALAGGQVEKCVKTTRKDFVVASGQEQKQATRHNTLDTRPWQGSINAGVGAQLNITDRYGISQSRNWSMTCLTTVHRRCIAATTSASSLPSVCASVIDSGYWATVPASRTSQSVILCRSTSKLMPTFTTGSPESINRCGYSFKSICRIAVAASRLSFSSNK